MVETLKTSNLVSDPKQRVGSDESVQFAALSAPGSFNVRVMNRQTVAEGIIYFELGPSYSEALPAWSPDAHIALESQGRRSACTTMRVKNCPAPSSSN